MSEKNETQPPLGVDKPVKEANGKVLRKIVIVTDGTSFQLEKDTTCSPLEIKAICAGILQRLGP